MPVCPCCGELVCVKAKIKPKAFAKYDTLKEIEVRVIRQRYFGDFQNDPTGCAISLGISRATLYRKLKKYRLK